MATRRTKKKSSKPGTSFYNPLGALWRYARGRGRTAVMSMGSIALFLGLSYGIWLMANSYVLSSENYWIGPDDVQITSLPQWIHSDIDIRTSAFRDASLPNRLSIMDSDLTEKIAAAFSLQPWVAEVQHVTKYYPARVEVQLAYRRPVCMVLLPPRTLLPVDSQGIVLPEADFSSNDKASYPRLIGIDTVPVGLVGGRWGDTRVLGGAEIADVLFDAWDKLNLGCIEASQISLEYSSIEPTYKLITHSGTRILWGRAPGSDIPGEALPAEKVARLLKYVKENGTLDGARGPQTLDVRFPQGLRVATKDQRITTTSSRSSQAKPDDEPR